MNLLKFSLLIFTFIFTNEIFACENLTEETQKLSCFKKKFSKVDKELNEVYKELLNKIPKELANEMKIESRTWIKRKESFCKDERVTGDSESSKENSSYYSCVLGFTESRIPFLKSAFGRENLSNELSGEYQDADGGELKLKMNKNKLEFMISVVRGPTSHIGEVSGKFEPTSKKILWKNKPNSEECELKFIFKDYVVEIEEVKCSELHGANAYFTGKYRKIK
ncbi:MAG: lysozyme inhibitor LprI family protein [Leptospiraceae bacterium]|nr:lysozyme inhibitor LprI family protein [Leptospiraceae bacterium]